MKRKKLVGSSIYYELFLALSVASVLRSWHPRIPMILALLLLLNVSIGGKRDYTASAREYIYYIQQKLQDFLFPLPIPSDIQRGR